MVLLGESFRKMGRELRSGVESNGRSASLRTPCAQSKGLNLSHSAKWAVLYLALTLFFGTILVFWDARPATNDLEQHWNRASLISHGQFVAYEDPQNPGHYGGYIDDEFVAFNNTAVNSPLAYFPSWFCRGSYRLACLLTLLVASVLTALGIFLAGDFATLLVAPAILPMIFLSYLYPTADAMTNAVSILFIGSVLGLYQGERRPGRAVIAGMVFLGILVGQVKVTCIILLFLMLLPFHSYYKKSGDLDWRLALPAIAGVASALWWSSFTGGIAPVYQEYEAYTQGIHTLVTNPLRLVKTILVTTFSPLDYTDSQANGGRNSQLFLGSEFVQLPALVMAPILIACVLLLVKGNGATSQFDRLDRAIIVVATGLFFVGTHFAMLASWSASRLGGYNQGIQTRYFVPEFPLVGLLAPLLGIVETKPKTMRNTIVALVLIGYVGIVIAHLMPVRV